MNDEFYIGYETAVPPGSRRLVFGVIWSVLTLAAALAGVIVVGQRAFADAVFEFGQVKDFAGTIVAAPYPVLLTPNGAIGLVAEGKHGADAIVRPFDGQGVTLRGSLIRRGGRSLIEVKPGSVTPTRNQTATARPLEASHPLPATRNLVGEIVDAKCYLGVMNPGEGAVHRDCAGICIRGGLPPMFATELDGAPVLLAMAAKDGRSLGPAIATLAGKRVAVSGSVTREPRTGQWTLIADVQDYRLTR
jgi:hypothetical protein